MSSYISCPACDIRIEEAQQIPALILSGLLHASYDTAEQRARPTSHIACLPSAPLSERMMSTLTQPRGNCDLRQLRLNAYHF